MNSQKGIMIFEGKTHTGVMQDKYLPRRISAGMKEPATATVVADLNPRVSTNSNRAQNSAQSQADDRPKHHGSETRQSVQISSRVKPNIKSEVARVAKLKNW